MADHRDLVKNTPEELAEVGEQLGYPMMLKSKTMAYDGRGKCYISSSRGADC
jgi:phosphoribosylaminoimidazole carboxylase